MQHFENRPKQLFPKVTNKNEPLTIRKDSKYKTAKSSMSKNPLDHETYHAINKIKKRFSNHLEENTLKSPELLKKSEINPKKLIKNKTFFENSSNETEKRKTFYGVISDFYLSRKFINLLKNLTSTRTPKYLSQYHFDLMNDRSFYFEEYLKTKAEQIADIAQNLKEINFKTQFILYWKKKLLRLSQLVGVFDINQSFTMIWNAIVGIALLYFFIYIPLFTCFNDSEVQESQLFNNFKLLFLSILLMDVLKRLNTSFYKKGSLIDVRREIVRNYMRGAVWLDIISLGPILYQEIASLWVFNEYYNFSTSYFRFMTFLIYFKLGQFNYIVKKFEEMIFINDIFHNTLALLKLIFRILLLSHIFACFWYLVGNSNIYETSWLTNYDLSGKEPWIKYLSAYYYVCVTMNTVGFGDITPQNHIEILFSIGFIYVACGVFAYSLNCIGIIVNDLTKRSNQLSKELNVINEFMNQKKIGFDLRMRVRNYLEYILKEEDIEKVEEQAKIIKKLSDSIKEELLIEANGAVIRDIKLFSLNFSEDTLRKTVLIMKEMRFTPGDIIFSKNDYQNKDLFLIRKGMIQLYIENQSFQCNSDTTVVKTLKEGDLFGEKSFFTDKQRTVSAKSIDFTTVYIINQEEFISILRRNTKDFEKFCEIKDKINVYHDASSLFVKCASCKKNSHLIDACPILHYIAAQEIIIQRYNYTPQQERTKHLRNSLRSKCQSLAKLNEIEKKALLYQRELRTENKSDDEDDESDVSNSKTVSYLSTYSISTENDKNENEFQENKIVEENEEDEEKKNEENDRFSNQDEESSKLFREAYIEKPKIIRQRDKKTAFLMFKKKPSFSRICAERRKNHETFNIGSLENLDIKLNDELSSKTSIHSCDASISVTAFLARIMEQLKLIIQKTNDPLQTSNENDNKSKSITPNGINFSERSFDIDAVKCYEGYFEDGNIHEILKKIENISKTCQKKIKRSKSIYNQLNASNCMHREKKKKKLHEAGKYKMTENIKGNIMRRNFFKNSRYLEKLIMEEEFNTEKIKAFYKKKYEEEKKMNLCQRFLKKLRKYFETSKRKKIKRLTYRIKV